MKTTVKLILALSLFCFIVGKAWADLNDGLVAYYPFNGNANDESGNGNHGIVNGATLTRDRFWNANSAYHFDGQDDYINCGGSGSSLGINKQLSISAWVKGNTLTPPAGYGLVTKYSFNTTKNHSQGWGLLFSGHFHRYIFLVLNETHPHNDGVGANSTSTFSTSWKHIVGVYDDVYLKIYVDGNLESSVIANSDILAPNNFNLLIGAYQHNGGEIVGRLDGLIDEVRIYNRTLSQSEVQQLYDAGTNDFIEKGKQECITNPASCDLFSQSQVDSAKQTGLNEGKETGRQECINNPSSCGIDVEKHTDGSTKAGIDKCQNDPASCDISIASLGGYTQEEYDKAYDNGWQACKDEPICVGSGETTITLTGDGFYTPGESVNIQLTENLDVHRFYRVDLWVIIETPDGVVLYMTDIPLNPFDIKQQPFLRSLESSNRTHQILDFEVPTGMGGDYVIYAFFNKAGADLSLLVKTLRSNIAVAGVTLRNY